MQTSCPHRRFHSLAPALALGLIATPHTCADDNAGTPVWSNWGGDLHNTHHAANETRISPSTVGRLALQWRVTTTGNVSAIPALSDTRVYVPDWGLPYVGGSKLYAIDRATGDVVFDEPIASYSHSLVNTVSRTTPAMTDDLLIFGDLLAQGAAGTAIGGHGAALYAVDRTTGDLVWKTTLDDHPFAVVTQSPTVYGGRVYVGVSSLQEAAARRFGDCCDFRGSMLSLDVSTGAIMWRRYMTPPLAHDGSGFTGAAVWGSSPAIDEARGLVYISTSNNYTVSTALDDCIEQYPGDADAQFDECYARLDPPENMAETVLALDLDTGAIAWTHKMRNSGAWTFACAPELLPWLGVEPDNCQNPEGLDYAIGQAPMLYTVGAGDEARDLLAVGQKSGVFWAMDPDTGETVWATSVGPGGVLGGMEFGAATDGQRIYTQITNFDHAPIELVAGQMAGATVTGGIWAALDAATGEILWQTPDPASFLPLDGWIWHPTWGGGLGEGHFGAAMGPLTVANGVVFAGSMDRAGHMYAMDAATGEILWSFESGGSVMSAPSISDGQVVWGSGYQTGANNNALYAFEVQ